jgi:O-antigen/teichoic acid export membrane protein
LLHGRITIAWGRVGCEGRYDVSTAGLVSGLRRRFVSGVAWSGAAAVFNQGSTFAVNVLVANLLGKEIFGRYAIVQTTLMTAGNLAQLALGYLATKYVAELRAREPVRAGGIITLCLLLAAVSGLLGGLTLLGTAPLLASTFLRAPAVRIQLAVAAAAVPCVAISGCASGILAGLEKFRAAGSAAVVAGIAYTVLGAGGAWLGGLTGGVVGLVLAYAVQTAALLTIALRAIRETGLSLSVRSALSERAAIVRFALPATLGSMSTLPALWLAAAVVARQAGGLSEVAIYSAANSLRVLVLFVPGVVNGVGISLLNHQRGLNDPPRLRRVFIANLLAVSGSAALGILVVGVAGPLILQLYGKSFSNGYDTLLILLGSTISESLAMALYQIMLANERLWASLLTVVVPRDATVVLLTYVLAPSLGARGMAIAYAAAWTLALLSIIVWARRIGLGNVSASNRKATEERTA